MESGMGLTNVCVYSMKTKCVCIHLRVCMQQVTPKQHLVSLHDVFGGHPWNMEKQGIIRSPQNSKLLGEVSSSQGVNS